MKKRAYVRPESIVVVMYNSKGVMGFEDFDSKATNMQLGKEFDLNDETGKKWGFGPEDIRFKEVWEDME
ncbi:MAG: hypothetical protein II934_07260 [Prevotella sp.]|nr:hypothetical protein [Prevotella sp.]